MQSDAVPVYRILVIDDEPMVADTVRLVLRADGHSVEVAHLGSEALAKLDQARFDLVITDFEMPELKGDRLVKEIRGRNPEQKIIMLTGHAEHVAPFVNGIGVNLLLGKPFDIREFRTAIQKVMRD
jgi:DNA-binding response OmpR family regulator